jgi:uncharacterized protein YdeI (YjbR/CyaY-like superfamily)
MKPKFFSSAADFGKWLKQHHATEDVLLVGYHKVGSGKPSMTWPESVDEALCWGWIDGVRNRLDENAYTIRFTPRRPGSKWSAVNVRRAKALAKRGRLSAAGRKAFEAKRENQAGAYSYEQRPNELLEPYAGMLAKNRKAHAFFGKQNPSYRRAATWWVISAKQEETRLRRAQSLIDFSAKGELIPQFLRKPGKP